MTSQRRILSIGAAPGGDEPLELAARHPTRQAPFQLVVDLDGQAVLAAEPRVGFMHRGDEKVLEVRDFRQALLLADRHDWLSPIASELAVALAIEDALGLVAPERATWTRTLLLECTRIATPLLLAGAAMPDPHALALHAQWTGLLESATGNRVHPMFTRIGGVAAPLSPAWLDDAGRWLVACADALPGIADRSGQRWAGLAGVGVLDPDAALGIGVTGPVLRACGVGTDRRRDEPRLAYAELEVPVPVTASAGDVPARYAVLLADAEASIALARACVQRLGELGEGPFDTRLPKAVRVPDSTVVADVEGPLGVVGVLLVSTGDKVPARIKLRTPGFASIQAMARGLSGVRREQLADAVMSYFVVAADVDR